MFIDVPKLVDEGMGDNTNRLIEPQTTPKQIADAFSDIKDNAVETLMAVYLKHDLTGHYMTHSIGGQAWCALDKHSLYGFGFMTRARYVVLVHNHPHGDATPSKQDIDVLKELHAGMKEFGAGIMHLLDFMIVAPDGSYWSWYETEGGDSYEDGALSISTNTHSDIIT